MNNINELSSWGIAKNINDVIENGFSYDEETGEVFFTPDDLEALNEALDKKLESICGIIEYSEAQAKALKDRKKEIDKTIKHYEVKATKLREFLGSLMEANGFTQTRTFGDYRLGFRKNTSLDVSDEIAAMKYIEQHPNLSDAINIKTETFLDKRKIREFINEGENIPGVAMVTTKSVSIK